MATENETSDDYSTVLSRVAELESEKDRHEIEITELRESLNRAEEERAQGVRDAAEKFRSIESDLAQLADAGSDAGIDTTTVAIAQRIIEKYFSSDARAYAEEKARDAKLVTG